MNPCSSKEIRIAADGGPAFSNRRDTFLKNAKLILKTEDLTISILKAKELAKRSAIRVEIILSKNEI
jgi:protein-disulfide isomerase-like protein with CxxC motif